MYAVTVAPLNATFFLADRPEGEGWEIEEGVDLDIPSNLHLWPDGEERPDEILCQSVYDKKHYKVFKSARDIDPAEFRPTNTNFGGVYSMSSWRRFLDSLPAVLATDSIADAGSPGRADESARDAAGAG